MEIDLIELIFWTICVSVVVMSIVEMINSPNNPNGYKHDDALRKLCGANVRISYGFRFVTYESLCGKNRVDFPLDKDLLRHMNKDLLDCMETMPCCPSKEFSPLYIEWQGERFVYVGYYDVNNLGRGSGDKVVGERYGKHFGEYGYMSGESDE
tara:strand:- start:34151 stop:34609 length:459 start_codon:yes stop_codon:yes gene_type:complete